MPNPFPPGSLPGRMYNVNIAGKLDQQRREREQRERAEREKNKSAGKSPTREPWVPKKER
jgi:hypothetical protein